MSIYLDNAATTPLNPLVLDAMMPYLTTRFGNPSSIHSAGRDARIAIDTSRNSVAENLRCIPEEIIFTGTTTDSNNLALQGIISSARGYIPHIITSAIEHHAVLTLCQRLSAQGKATVSIIPVDQFGMVNPDDIFNAIKPQTILVSIMYANNEVGTIQPIDEIINMIETVNIKRVGDGQPKIYVHTDAATVAEFITLDTQKLKIDLLSLGAHKFHGPKGIGLLYIRKGTELEPILFGGNHERSFWPGTENVAGIVGMATAFKIAQAESEVNTKRISPLRDYFIEEILKRIPKSVLTGHPSKRLPDIASFTFEGAEGEAILLHLDKNGIEASSGSACTAGDLHPSHVLLALGIPPAIAHSSIRFSIGIDTTEAELRVVIDTLPPIIEMLRSMSPYGKDVSEKIV